MSDVSNYISKYLTWKQTANSVSRNGMLRYKSRLKHFATFLAEYNISNIDDITYEVLKEYQKYLSSQKTMNNAVRKIGTQNCMLSSVNVFVSWLVQEGILTTDPTVNIEYANNHYKLDGGISKNYPGGKGAVFQQLVNLMPPHEVYIESHLGNGAVMRRKRPAQSNIGVEIDPKVIEMWNKEDTINFDLIHGDAITFLKEYEFTGKELVYCDPPYLRETRKKSKPMYKYEYSANQHNELLDILKTLPCNIMISGYQSTLYSEKLKDWHCQSFQATTSNGVATEWVWMNYSSPLELHDYRYFGENFRERERMKLKNERWLTRLNKMPSRDRQILLNALNWVWHDCSDTYELYDYHSLGDNFRERERRNRKRQGWIKQLKKMPVLEKLKLLDTICRTGLESESENIISK